MTKFGDARLVFDTDGKNLSDKTGDLSSLQTTNKGSLVNAINETVSSLADIAIHVSNYGAKADGVSDDTAAIQVAIDYAASHNIKKVILTPKKEYKTNGVIYLKDNVELDGNGATIKSSVTTDYIGAIQFAGSNPETPYPLTADLTDGQISLTVTNASSIFVAGDFVYISQDEPIDSSTDANHLKRFTSQILEIASISGNTITLMEPIVHNYYVSSNAKIQRVVPVKNASVSNLTVDHLGTLNVVHSVYFNISVNCSVKNIKSYNSAGKGVQVYRSRYFDVDGVKTYKRTDVSAGKGYSCMVSSSSFGTVKRVYGFASRHTVDLSDGSHNVSVSDCYGFNISTASFSTHGQNVRKVTFSNCHVVGAAFGFQIGDSSFRFDQEIQITNCTATACSNTGFFVSTYSRDCIIENCIAEGCNQAFRANNSIRASMIGCKSINATVRGLLIETNAIDTKISNFSSTGNPTRGVDINTVTNVQIDNLKVDGAFADYALLINASTDVTINNLNVDGTCTTLIEMLSSTNIRINGFNVTGNASQYGLEIITNCKYVYLNNGKITPTVGLDAVRLGTSTTLATDSTQYIYFNHVRMEANGNYADKKLIRATCMDLSITNCNLTGTILSFATSKIMIANNFRINGALDIRATTGVVYTNNIGTISIYTMPAHDGTNVINQNNLVAIS